MASASIIRSQPNLPGSYFLAISRPRVKTGSGQKLRFISYTCSVLPKVAGAALAISACAWLRAVTLLSIFSKIFSERSQDRATHSSQEAMAAGFVASKTASCCAAHGS